MRAVLVATERPERLAMRILYGAFAQGQGHFSKAAVLVPLLESRGHSVRVVSSGGEVPPEGYRFTWHRHFPGLSYVVSGGITRYGDSFKKWLSQVPRVFRNLMAVRSIAQEFQPNLVISDFEPLTASPLIEANCEVIALSRQVALFDRGVPLPAEMAWERKMTRTVIRMFSAGATRHFGYHYAPSSPRCVPPVIRPDLSSTERRNGDHIVVYNVYHAVEDGSAESLACWAQQRRVLVRAYGFPRTPRGRQGWVEFKPSSRQGLLEDMATSRGVYTSAGLTTAVEAFLLGKPACVVPIPGQWEQCVNAFHLEEAGIAGRCPHWDYDRLLERSAPSSDHPLRGWLSTSAERILDFVLTGRPLPSGEGEPSSALRQSRVA